MRGNRGFRTGGVKGKVVSVGEGLFEDISRNGWDLRAGVHDDNHD